MSLSGNRDIQYVSLEIKKDVLSETQDGMITDEKVMFIGRITITRADRSSEMFTIIRREVVNSRVTAEWTERCKFETLTYQTNYQQQDKLIFSQRYIPFVLRHTRTQETAVPLDVEDGAAIEFVNKHTQIDELIIIDLQAGRIYWEEFLFQNTYQENWSEARYSETGKADTITKSLIDGQRCDEPVIKILGRYSDRLAIFYKNKTMIVDVNPAGLMIRKVPLECHVMSLVSSPCEQFIATVSKGKVGYTLSFFRDEEEIRFITSCELLMKRLPSICLVNNNLFMRTDRHALKINFMDNHADGVLVDAGMYYYASESTETFSSKILGAENESKFKKLYEQNLAPTGRRALLRFLMFSQNYKAESSAQDTLKRYNFSLTHQSKVRKFLEEVSEEKKEVQIKRRHSI